MPVIELTREIDASPETIWRVLASHREWPHWSPLFQNVISESPELGMAGEWTIHGTLGRIPYNGLFRTEAHRPVEALVVSAIRVSPPYDFVRHTALLERGNAPRLTWRIHYTTAGGPGGWIIDRLLIRRGVSTILGHHLDALEAEVGSSPLDTDRRPETGRMRSTPPY